MPQKQRPLRCRTERTPPPVKVFPGAHRPVKTDIKSVNMNGALGIPRRSFCPWGKDSYTLYEWRTTDGKTYCESWEYVPSLGYNMIVLYEKSRWEELNAIAEQLLEEAA
jgi:hypothetical protein